MTWTWRALLTVFVAPIVAAWSLAQVDRRDAGHHRPTPISGATA